MAKTRKRQRCRSEKATDSQSEVTDTDTPKEEPIEVAVITNEKNDVRAISSESETLATSDSGGESNDESSESSSSDTSQESTSKKRRKVRRKKIPLSVKRRRIRREPTETTKFFKCGKFIDFQPAINELYRDIDSDDNVNMEILDSLVSSDLTEYGPNKNPNNTVQDLIEVVQKQGRRFETENANEEKKQIDTLKTNDYAEKLVGYQSNVAIHGISRPLVQSYHPDQLKHEDYIDMPEALFWNRPFSSVVHQAMPLDNNRDARKIVAKFVKRKAELKREKILEKVQKRANELALLRNSSYQHYRHNVQIQQNPVLNYGKEEGDVMIIEDTKQPFMMYDQQETDYNYSSMIDPSDIKLEVYDEDPEMKHDIPDSDDDMKPDLDDLESNQDWGLSEYISID